MSSVLSILAVVFRVSGRPSQGTEPLCVCVGVVFIFANQVQHLVIFCMVLLIVRSSRSRGGFSIGSTKRIMMMMIKMMWMIMMHHHANQLLFQPYRYHLPRGLPCQVQFTSKCNAATVSCLLFWLELVTAFVLHLFVCCWYCWLTLSCRLVPIVSNSRQYENNSSSVVTDNSQALRVPDNTFSKWH